MDRALNPASEMVAKRPPATVGVWRRYRGGWPISESKKHR
jgi:hypothetical protein